MQTREKIISDYIEAYNYFDVEGMIAHLDESIHFENISNGIINMSLDGLSAFKQQASRQSIFFLKEHKRLNHSGTRIVKLK